ncbi:MAG: LPS export ABC transporter periplasmic protein LptC [Gammaproteobacteria bacterium]|nr:LPS export ABC transporter periplasmic protein LptC [Gammaproteobacteria bacterium]
MRTLSFIARRNLFIGLMLLAVIGSWMLLDREREESAATEDRPATPDSYFTDMELVRHDENGRPSMTVRARSATHYPNDPLIYMEAVDARGKQADANWALTAATGELSSENNRLHVEDNVLLVQNKTGRPPLEMSTVVLDIDADSEVVETDAAIEIRYGKSTVTGKGLWASLADGRMIIESKVRARYEP